MGGEQKAEKTQLCPHLVSTAPGFTCSACEAERQAEKARRSPRLCPTCRDVLRYREDRPDLPPECPRHGAVLAEKTHTVEVSGGAHGWVHRCITCGYRGPEAPPLPCPGPQAENDDTRDDDTSRIPRCIEDRCAPGPYGAAAIFHPAHGTLCPRRVVNVENYCRGCGIAVHYARHHRSWCPEVVVPPASTAPVQYHERAYVHPSGARRGYLCCCPEGKPHEVPVNDEWLTEEEVNDAE